MDVIAHRPQIPIPTALHVQGLVTSGEKMSALLMPDVETLGVNSQQPFHPSHQIGFRGFQHQMKMIAPQAIGVNLPVCLATSLRQAV